MNPRNYAINTCGELRTIGMQIGYIRAEKGKVWLKKTESLSAMVGSLIRNKKNLNNSKHNLKETRRTK